MHLGVTVNAPGRGSLRTESVGGGVMTKDGGEGRAVQGLTGEGVWGCLLADGGGDDLEEAVVGGDGRWGPE